MDKNMILYWHGSRISSEEIEHYRQVAKTGKYAGIEFIMANVDCETKETTDGRSSV